MFSNTEAARCDPSYDAYPRLLPRCKADGNALWEEVRPWVALTDGFLIIDDATLDKPNSRAIEIEYWATSDLQMSVAQCAEYAHCLWRIGEYHCGIKQFCGIERVQHRSVVAQRNPIGLALRAFLGLESHRLRTGTPWFEAKAAIVREAIRASLAQPLYTHISTA